MPKQFRIDTGERFERLHHAPIVEAVIDFRAQARVDWEENALRTELSAMMPDYQFMDSQRMIQHTFEIQPGKAAEQQVRDLGLKGVRFRAKDLVHIAAFQRDGFTFSRLKPYDTWEQFKGEAKRLWAVHQEVAKVTDVDRIGVRYINRIALGQGEADIEDYIDPHPDSPRGLDLPFLEYFQRDTFDVPGYPYAVTVIRTIQGPQGSSDNRSGLIVDIDAFTQTGPFPHDDEGLENVLADLRWLKNKAFLGTITEKALVTLRGNP